MTIFVGYGAVLVPISGSNPGPDLTTSSLVVNKAGWCWFADPRAFRYTGTQDRIYGGTQRPNGDIYAFQIDLNSGAVSEFAIDAPFERDDHDNPSLVMRHDGKLIAFWSTHGGSPMKMRTATNAESIAAWGSVTNLPALDTGYTYPNPMQLSSEGAGSEDRLFLTWRGANFNVKLAYTDDYGTAWQGATGPGTAAYTLIDDTTDRFYVKAVSNGVDRWDLFCTTGHPNSVASDLYHLYYQGGAFKKSDGTTIRANLAALAASPIALSEMTKIYDDATDGRAWVWDIAYDSTGKPVVAFATFPTDANHQYYRGRWTGSAWSNKKVSANGGPTIYVVPNPAYDSATDEPKYSHGIMLDHSNTDRVAYVESVAGVSTFKEATTSDGGDTWSATSVASVTTPRKLFRPIGIRNHGTGPRWGLLDGTYYTFQDWNAVLRCYPQIPGVTQAAEPTVTAAPTFTPATGTTGTVLTCGTGTWTGSPSEYRYQWMRNDTMIPGESAATHTLHTRDIGQVISCVVTAVNGGGIGVVETSNTHTPAS